MTTITVQKAAPKKAGSCVHHWLVTPPQAETSWGKCLKCGRRKRFTNRFAGRDRANNSDLFSEGTHGWKPDRRSTYYDPAAADVDGSALAATAV